jgi:hypothetical protein
MVRRKRRRTTDDPRIYNPPPHVIRRESARIRAGWDERTFQERGWKKTVPFSWPTVSDQELIEALEEAEQDERGDS